MNSGNALRLLAEVAAAQWGMVTSAQATRRGVSRLILARLTDAGLLKRLAHGVYRLAGVPSTPLEHLRAAWLSTSPGQLAEGRLRDPIDGVVVAGSSAAMLHEIGDFWAHRHEFVTPKRRQTQRPDIRYRLRQLDPQDITIVGGLPVMGVERALADLLEDMGDISLVADALRDAVHQGSVDSGRLRELLAPLALRHNFRRHDGDAVMRKIQVSAGLPSGSASRSNPVGAAH